MITPRDLKKGAVIECHNCECGNRGGVVGYVYTEDWGGQRTFFHNGNTNRLAWVTPFGSFVWAEDVDPNKLFLLNSREREGK